MTQLIQVRFADRAAMYTDARHMHNRLLQAASRADTHTLFRAQNVTGTRFTVLTDDERFDPSRWGDAVTDLTTEVYAPTVARGARVLFEVRLCPVTRSTGKTVRALRGAGELDPFIERLGQRHGFEVLSYATQWERGYRIDRQAPPLPSVTVSGELEAIDEAQIVGALYRGVGRAKRFGFGLLLIRPLE